MNCPNCHADNPLENKFCFNCGEALPASSSIEVPFEDVPSDEEAQASKAAQAPTEKEAPESTLSPAPNPKRKTILIGAISAGALAVICLIAIVALVVIYKPNVTINLAALYESSPTPRPTATRRETPTPSVTPTLPTPTLEATATSAPAFSKNWTTAQVVSAILRARLEASNTRTMTPEDYGTVPRVATEAIRYFIPTLGGQKGGRIFAFATPKDLETVKQFYESGKSGAATREWIYVKDNILLQITGDLPEQYARQYQNALNSLR